MDGINSSIVLESGLCRLEVGEDCIVRSLRIKPTGEECAVPGEEISLFSVTQERPFNNEVKLAHPNRRMTFQANRIRREGDRLIIGFEITPFEAVVRVREAARYIALTLEDFIVHPDDYPGLCMTPPPVSELRLVQLPVKKRENFGEWLNVNWDDSAAVNVLSTSPHARIGTERRKSCRIMTADAVRGIKLRGCGAAIIAAPKEELLDAIADVEEDYDLPRGVASRRDAENINASIYWTADINPQNADEHIELAKRGGFRMMLIYYTAFFRDEGSYLYTGDYDWRPEYPNGCDSLREMLERIKAAGITPGIHFLQTHIGLRSRYVTPVADHRLNLTRHFTLAKPLDESGGTVWVEECPEDSPMHEKCRILRFGGELISYETFTTERPYRFEGCMRGACATRAAAHPLGEIGGVLDVSEFGGGSVYIDQNSGLQDEIAEKLADAYNAGFRFVYFDGSEGTNVPHDFHVPNAQYRVLSRFEEPPLFAEGAAKAHFSWHFLSGGNAFDIFPPEQFKAAIDRYPAKEAPQIRMDFTRLNFGWWNICPGTQADLFEYGESRAAAWDCPVTLQAGSPESLRAHPRIDDLLETLRRWEDVRRSGWLTEEQKQLLRKPGEEYTLLINGGGEYELVRWEQIKCGDGRIRAFIFERGGAWQAAYWLTEGEGELELALDPAKTAVSDAPDGPEEAARPGCGGAVVPAGAKRYLKSALAREEIERAFVSARLI